VTDGKDDLNCMYARHGVTEMEKYTNEGLSDTGADDRRWLRSGTIECPTPALSALRGWPIPVSRTRSLERDVIPVRVGLAQAPHVGQGMYGLANYRV